MFCVFGLVFFFNSVLFFCVWLESYRRMAESKERNEVTASCPGGEKKARWERRDCFISTDVNFLSTAQIMVQGD